MREDISGLVLEAVADNSKWVDVLQVIMRQCGAMTGVITLRDLDTAELFFPEEATSQLTAPLVINIGPEFIASYFDRYAECDVWTTIEKNNYPVTPYFMSDHMSIDLLKQHEFWGWLEPQGICECLVAEVHRSPRHWVALNLHFGATSEQRKSEILATLDGILHAVRSGWALSERLIGLSQAKAASQGYLESWPQPSMIVDEDFVVTSANRLAQDFYPKRFALTQPVVVGAQLAMEPGPLRAALEGCRDNPLSGHDGDELLPISSDVDDHIVRISRIGQGSDVVGKRRAHFLIVAEVLNATSAAIPRIWETEGLTRMQSAVVKWIAEGGVVPTFAALNQIAPKTAYDHLYAARQKLDNISSRDIYTTHQALLRIRH